MVNVDGNGERVPTALRVFGGQLKLFRELASMSREELGRQLGYASHTIKSYELAQRIPEPATVERADELLGAKGVLRAAIPLLEEVQYPKFFRDLPKLEKQCTKRYSYDPHCVPGLLQTEAYASAVIGWYIPAFTEDEVARLVGARLDRQAMLTRDDRPAVHFVVEQAALERPMGGRKIHRGQIEKLLEWVQLRNVSIQVMPTNVAHPGLDGAMTLLDMPDRRTVVYVEGQAHGLLVSDREKVNRMAQRYDMIRTQALALNESLQFIEELAGKS
ncbi:MULTISPECIES: helix-turn-helix transcriptional regulator [unclassified Streptomyces]|uniref:helix-turn-helix domain-containing protein n=1 Tax=unclassified Streptomyces TaxID=2593676 RepID=UPI0015E0C4B5|nr:helix-turn-helix transcriptional regulator [Streptomyces sp. CB02959]